MLYLPEAIWPACCQPRSREPPTIMSDFCLSRWFVFAHPPGSLMGEPSSSQRYGLQRFARFLPFCLSVAVFAFGIAGAVR